MNHSIRIVSFCSSLSTYPPKNGSVAFINIISIDCYRKSTITSASDLTYLPRSALTAKTMLPATKTTTIDWNSPDVLEQLVQNIKSPLESIMTLGKNSTGYDKDKLEEIIFTSSKEISDIVEEIMIKAKAKSLSLTYRNRPEIFGIYESNENVRKMCLGEINPQKVTKIDQEWLMNLEKEVYENISQSYLDLGELSYKMAVSERQLHRKIFNIVALTPNKYVRILRLHKAKQIIDNYIQQSVQQISYAVGYNDVHYFSKLFACQYGVSPKDMLNSFR